MSLPQTQGKRKSRIVVSEESEETIETSKVRNNRYPVNRHFSDSVSGVEGRYFLTSLLENQDHIYSVFPFLEGSVNRGVVKAVVPPHLIIAKYSSTPSERQELFVAPPPSVQEEDWFCFLGPLCPTFFRGANCFEVSSAVKYLGHISPSFICPEHSLNRHFFMQNVLIPSYVNYAKEAKLKSTLPANLDLSDLLPLCLYPIETEEDVKTAQNLFGSEFKVNSGQYFACPHHFERGKGKNKIDAYLGVINKEVRVLKPPTISAVRKKYLTKFLKNIPKFKEDPVNFRVCFDEPDFSEMDQS